MTTKDIYIMWPRLVIKTILRWWLQKAEQHYLRCAEVEKQRAREAQLNEAYYQKRAALARSIRISL